MEITMDNTNTGEQMHLIFEHFARTCDGNCNEHDLRRNAHGEYINQLVARDFLVFQAALSQAGEQMRQVREALERIVEEPKNTLSDGKAIREMLRQAKFALAAIAQIPQPIGTTEQPQETYGIETKAEWQAQTYGSVDELKAVQPTAQPAPVAGAVDAACVLEALQTARQYVDIQNCAEGMFDGFGGRKPRPSDGDLRAVVDAIAALRRNAAEPPAQQLSEPVANITVKDGSITGHLFYTHNLPDGEYRLYPVRQDNEEST